MTETYRTPTGKVEAEEEPSALVALDVVIAHAHLLAGQPVVRLKLRGELLVAVLTALRGIARYPDERGVKGIIYRGVELQRRDALPDRTVKAYFADGSRRLIGL